MKKMLLLFLSLCGSVIVCGYGYSATPAAPLPDQAAAKAEQRQDVLFTCNCGPGCTCNTVKTAPGVCHCGNALKGGHVLKIEGNEAIVCQCGEGCVCNLNPQDPSKCSCGKAVKRVNLKGSGIYFCNCGSSCLCNTVSEKPGKCKCGMDLKKVD